MLITNIGRLITMEPAKGREGPLGIIKNAAVQIEDGKIKWIGSSCHCEETVRHGGRRRGNLQRTIACGRLLRRFTPRNDIIDANGCVVIPGLIDCHTHLVHAGSRVNEFAMRARGSSYKDIAKAGGGIMSTVRVTREASEDELFRLASARAKESLSYGVTTVEVKSGYGLDVETELKILRVVKRLKKELPQDLIATFLGAHAFPNAHPLPNPPPSRGRGGWGGAREQYINLIISEMLPAVAKEGLAKFCDVFVEKIAFTKKEAEEILQAAKKYGLKLKLHADQLTSGGGAFLASKLHAVSADHLEHVSKKDMKAMAKAKVVAVLIPSSTFFIGGKYAPARELLDAGVKVAIATDYNPGTSPILNLWLAATMAITQMKMTPEEVYQAITINAARALALEDKKGSIAVGKAADMVLLGTQNEFDPFYRFDKTFISKIIKGGKII